ncbi:MAG: GNAT family N-acetyltransferase [Beijerinckiaceae bacterium]|nr:GNAT family N-acetyltransferase [Beijerinckiaceae bacterium]
MGLMAGTLPVIQLRAVRDADAQDLFGLITLCFADYPGCFVDPHDDLPDLVAPAKTIEGKNGGFWVIEDERGRVAACCAIDFPQDGVAEVHRLYVRPDMRRGGLAQRLMERCETFARERGAGRIILWSDTRFETAHRFYARRGYRRGPEPRSLDDISHSLEYFFERDLK